MCSDLYMSRDQLLTDHTAVLHGHNEGQLCYKERDTEVDVVPHAP